MKITTNGASIEAIFSVIGRPNISTITDVDGAIININTITLIEIYEMMEKELKTNFNMTIGDIKAQYNRE